MSIQVAGVARGKENAVERLFRNHRAFVPAHHLRGAMAAIIALFVRPMSLRIVILDPCAVKVLHFLPTPRLMEKIVSHSSDDIDYVELTHPLLLLLL